MSMNGMNMGGTVTTVSGTQVATTPNPAVGIYTNTPINTSPNDFALNSTYNPDSSFTQVKFGTNRALLNTELNEMQLIQESARADMLRRLTYSGFYALTDRGWDGQPFVLFPNQLINSFAFSPAELNVNGYKVMMMGNTTLGGVSGYNLVQLDPPPNTVTYRCDLVFLEVWFEEFDSATAVTDYGFVNGNVIVPNPMMNPLVNTITSHRVGIQWRLRVADGIDFDTYPSGLGVMNSSMYSPVYGYGANNMLVNNPDYVFMAATDPTFSSTNFYLDGGLYVAGRPGNTQINADLGIFGQYVFAIPLFKVFRRNSLPYSPSSNPYGADVWVNEASVSARYDGLFANVVAANDITDLRHTLILNELTGTELLNSSFKELITGNLQTAVNEVMHRAQFGVEAFQPADNSSTILYEPFDGNYAALILNASTGLLEDATGNVVGTPTPNVNHFLPSVNNYGLLLDGSFQVVYPNVPFNSMIGTIDFWLKPYWEGSDPTVVQTLLSVTDSDQNPFLILLKSNDKLMLTVYQTPYSNSVTSTVAMPFSSYTVDNNRFYQFRVAWNMNTNVTNIYLNGNLAATGGYLQSQVIPTQLIVGKDIVIPNPTVTLSPQVDNSVQNSLLTVGTYYLTYTYVTSTGETTAAPESSVNLTVAYNAFSFLLPSMLPTGVTAINIYLGTTSGGETFLSSYVGPWPATAPYVITSLPMAGMQGLPLTNTASIPPDTLTPFGEGSLIDELIVYNSALIYASEISPQVPLDFADGLATIYPSFNGLMRDFADNAYKQTLLTMQVPTSSGSTSFTVQTPLPNAVFDGSSANFTVYTLGTYESVPGYPSYNSYTGVDSGKQLAGTWLGLGTPSVTFTLTSGTSFTGDNVQLLYALDVDGGHGLLDLPGKLLYATINTNVSEQEAAFNLYNSAPRYVNLVNAQTVAVTTNGQAFSLTDYALDYATANYTVGDAYARLLYHYKVGNNTTQYIIAASQYGFDVMGLVMVNSYYGGVLTSTPPVESISYVPTQYGSNGQITAAAYYVVMFAQAITSNVILEFQLSLAGVTFDYNPYNKSVMSDIMLAEMITYYPQGNAQELTFPVKVDPLASGHGGCTVAYLGWSSSMDPSLVPAGYPLDSLYTAYVSASGSYTAQPVQLNQTYVGSPFISIEFLNLANGNLYEPPAGATILIPILRTYQPEVDKTLYIWYDKIPYQGVMSNATYNLKRVTGWLPFITTLSSGNTYLASENVNMVQLPKNSIYNTINRLPGGKSEAYLIDGAPIITESLPNMGVGGSINNQLLILSEYTDLVSEAYNLDAAVLTLSTNFTINKVDGNYQDGKTALPFSLMGLILANTVNPIHKYVGAATIVINEATGELNLLVFGSLQNRQAQTISVAQAEFCDLFYIPTRPLMKFR